MEAKEVISKFCELQGEVQNFLGYETAADCFCGQGGFWGSADYDGTFSGGYRNDGVALAFIQRAVQMRMREEKIEQAIVLIQKARSNNGQDSFLQDAIIALVDFKK